MIFKLLLLCQLSFASWMSFLWNKDKDGFSKKDQENSSILLEQEDTPVDFEQPIINITEENSRSWRAPDYSLSKGSLGYTEDVFSVPEGLKAQVDFWKNIYTKYSSWQGVLHDSEYIDHIYAVVDFTPIMKDSSLTDREVRKRRLNLVKDKKLEIKKRLLYLQSVKDPEVLSGEDLKVWQMYQNIDKKNKFRDAAQKGRLRFQLGQSDYFLQGIYSSGRYIEEMEKIFKSYNLPIELTRLPFVESSFNLNARSKVGASGIWQFMRSTGRSYMKVNSIADYRNHPIAATKAAAKKMRSNYNLTESWPLAITGYNYGPSGIRRLSQKLKTKDLAEIIQKEKSSRFGFASSNFFASYLAALYVEKNAATYFKNPKWMKPLNLVEYRLKRSLRYNTIEKSYEEKGYEFALYNPHFSSYTKRVNLVVPKGYDIYLPEDASTDLETALNKIDSPVLKATTSGDHIQYRVMRGDTLSGIATNFGVRIQEIIDQNGLSSARIYVGQRLLIPAK